MTIDTRWNMSNLPALYIYSDNPRIGLEIYPHRITKLDLSGDEVILIAYLPNEMWRDYLNWKELHVSNHWLGVETNFGAIGILIYDMKSRPAGDPFDVHELNPDPKDLAFRDLYLELAGYSHVHFAFIDDEGAVQKWFEVANTFDFDKMVTELEAFGAQYGGFESEDMELARYTQARNFLYTFPEPKQLFEVARRGRSEGTMLRVKLS